MSGLLHCAWMKDKNHYHYVLGSTYLLFDQSGIAIVHSKELKARRPRAIYDFYTTACGCATPIEMLIPQQWTVILKP